MVKSKRWGQRHYTRAVKAAKDAGIIVDECVLYPDGSFHVKAKTDVGENRAPHSELDEWMSKRASTSQRYKPST